MTTIGNAALAAALAAMAAIGTTAPSRADDPPMHQVRYVVTAASPIWADIYYWTSSRRNTLTTATTRTSTRPRPKLTSRRAARGPHPW